MVTELAIKNYKSVADLYLKPKRVNLFIGEHNAGKSNLLEALSFFSVDILTSESFGEIVRYKSFSNLFYDFNTSLSIEISTNELSLKIRAPKTHLPNHFEAILFESPGYDPPNDGEWATGGDGVFNFNLDIRSNLPQIQGGHVQSNFRTYQYKRLKGFNQSVRKYLSPPYGDNLPSIMQSNTDIKKLISDFFKSKGYKLMLKPYDFELEMAKEMNDELYGFPYQIISETMQRYVFCMSAIRSNENCTLVMDEPDANMFPFFVKELAETIADDRNQYFISTHNPFMISSLIEKTNRAELAVYRTYMSGDQTTAHLCSQDNIEELVDMGSSALFNLDNINWK
jgi:hypothetical protein